MRNRTNWMRWVSALALSAMLGDSAAIAADCFGSVAWQTVGTSALCMATSPDAWASVAANEEVVDFAGGRGTVPVVAGGTVANEPVEVAWIPEVTLDAIGRDDYQGDPGVEPVPQAQRLRAGRHSEMCLDVPEIPAGSTWSPARSSFYDPSQGLYVALERGVSFRSRLRPDGRTTAPVGGDVRSRGARSARSSRRARGSRRPRRVRGSRTRGRAETPGGRRLPRARGASGDGSRPAAVLPA